VNEEQKGLEMLQSDRTDIDNMVSLAIVKSLNRVIAANRPAEGGKVEEFRKGCIVRRHVVKRRWALTNGSNDSIVLPAGSTGVALYPAERGVTFPNQSPPKRLFAIDTLRVRLPAGKTSTTMEQLMQGLWMRVRYQDDAKPPQEIPFSKLGYQSNKLVAGVGGNIGGAGAVAVSIAGEIIPEPAMGFGFKLNDGDMILVAPQDTVKHVEFFWSTDLAATPTTLVGDDTVYEVDIEAEGDLYIAAKR